jgi:hypothetical protein
MSQNDLRKPYNLRSTKRTRSLFPAELASSRHMLSYLFRDLQADKRTSYDMSVSHPASLQRRRAGQQ